LAVSNPTPAERLSTEIADLPLRAQTASKRGFQLAATLSEADLNKVTELMLREFLSGGGNVTDEMISKEVGIPRVQAGRLAVPFMISIGLITEYSVSPEEFTSRTRDILFEPSEESIVFQFVQKAIPRRSELSSSASRSRLANAVLPSLTGLSIAVDVRLGFTDNKVDEFAPVALLRLDTDVNEQSLWLQLDKPDVEILIEQLNTAKRQMELSEELLRPLLKAPSDQKLAWQVGSTTKMHHRQYKCQKVW
jgi:hypothetical protein